MPVFEIEDPTTGQTLELEGDSPPSEIEIEEIFAGLPALGQDQEQAQAARGTAVAEEPGFLENIAKQALGGLETGAAVLSGAGAEVAAGFGGIAKTITSGPEAGEEVIGKIREGLTFQPRTVEGIRNLEAVGEFIAPVGKGLQRVEGFLGDLSADVFKDTGSPTLQGFAGAFGASLPTAALEILGFKGAGKLAKRKGLKQEKKRTLEQEKAIQEVAPTAEQLKQVSRGVYKEIDDLGATVKSEAYGRMVDDVQASLKKGGFRPRIDDKVAALLDELNEGRVKAMAVADVDDLRSVAQGFAKSIDPKTKSLGLRIIDGIDDMLDAEDVLAFPRTQAQNVGKSYKAARKFWGQARRSEKIQELQELAEGNRASFLQGVQTEFKQLIRSHIKGKAPGKYFPKEEIKLMQQVVSGDKTVNLFKNLAKLQITRAGGGSLIPLLGPGAGAFSLLAGGGAAGAGVTVLFPIIGEISNALATKLTKNNLKFADDMIRAGTDGRKIARAYFENVPKAQRTAKELGELLVDPTVDISRFPKTKFTEEALKEAARLRQQRTFAAGQVAIAQRAEEEGEFQ